MSTIKLSDNFLIKTTIIYPPFKNGLYLEEYFSRYFIDKNINLDRTFINAFWTNLQIDHNFGQIQPTLQQDIYNRLDFNNKYFAVVQHDDGILFDLPKNTIIFGCCGNIPLPLIYEDTTNYLESFPKVSYKDKYIDCSFVGCLTHNVRREIYNKFNNRKNFVFKTNNWTPNVSKTNAEQFIDITLKSKFVLAPRGYGRSSFRFFEVFKLGSIPIYVWDDIEWLPYKEEIDYSKFCISLNIKDIDKLPDIINSIDEQKYNQMIDEYKKVENYFTLEGMSDYILRKVKTL